MCSSVAKRATVRSPTTPPPRCRVSAGRCRHPSGRTHRSAFGIILFILVLKYIYIRTLLDQEVPWHCPIEIKPLAGQFEFLAAQHRYARTDPQALWTFSVQEPFGSVRCTILLLGQRWSRPDPNSVHAFLFKHLRVGVSSAFCLSVALRPRLCGKPEGRGPSA